MPVLRIARITYDHEPLEISEKGGLTIGQQVDKHIDTHFQSVHGRHESQLHEIQIMFEEGEAYRLMQLCMNQSRKTKL